MLLLQRGIPMTRITKPGGKRSVILIFCEDKLCGFFQYFVNDTTFRMDEIQFKKEYQGCGLFAELYHYLTTVIPAGTRYVEAFARKENLKSQGILEHLGLSVVGESKNGNSLHFKGEYKALSERHHFYKNAAASCPPASIYFCA